MNINAWIADAILDLREQPPEQRLLSITDEKSRFMTLIQRCYLLNKNSPVVSNYLALHFFYQWKRLTAYTFTVIKGSKCVFLNVPLSNKLLSSTMGIDLTKELHPGQLVKFQSSLHLSVSKKKNSIMPYCFHLDVAYPGESNSETIIFVKSSLKRMNTLVSNTYYTTNAPELRSATCFLMGLYHHSLNQYDLAYEQYVKSSKLLHSFEDKEQLSFYHKMLYHLSQLNTGVDKKKAKETMELLLQKYPQNVQVLYALGVLYKDLGEKEKAITYLKKVIELQPGNVDALLAMANILQSSKKKIELEYAVNAYIGAEKLLSTMNNYVPMALYINLGTLYHRIGQYSASVVTYFKALNADLVHKRTIEIEKSWKDRYAKLNASSDMDDDVTEESQSIEEDLNALSEWSHKLFDEMENMEQNIEDIVPHFFSRFKLTYDTLALWYNLALASNAAGSHGKFPCDLLKLIIDKFPSYLDAPMVLSQIYIQQGDRQQASEILDNVIEYCSKMTNNTASNNTKASNEKKHNMKDDGSSYYMKCKADALLLQAQIYAQAREWREAQHKYEKILSLQSYKNDPYTFLSLGNLYTATLNEPGRYQKHLDLSFGFYRKILQLHRKNIYAVHGIGIYFAEKGSFDRAKQIFSIVRQSLPEYIYVYLNLGHIYMAEEKFLDAARAYKTGLIKARQSREQKAHSGMDSAAHKIENDREIEVKLCLLVAKAYYYLNQFTESISSVSETLEIYQDEILLQYDLAFLLEHYSLHILCQTMAKNELVGKDSPISSAIKQTLSSQGSTGSQSKLPHQIIEDVQTAIGSLNKAVELFSKLEKIFESLEPKQMEEGGVPYENDKDMSKGKKGDKGYEIWDRSEYKQQHKEYLQRSKFQNHIAFCNGILEKAKVHLAYNEDLQRQETEKEEQKRRKKEEEIENIKKKEDSMKSSFKLPDLAQVRSGISEVKTITEEEENDMENDSENIEGDDKEENENQDENKNKRKRTNQIQEDDDDNEQQQEHEELNSNEDGEESEMKKPRIDKELLEDDEKATTEKEDLFGSGISSDEDE